MGSGHKVGDNGPDLPSLPGLLPTAQGWLQVPETEHAGGGLTAVGVRRMGPITSPWDLASLAFMAQKAEEVMSAAS